MLNTVCLKIIKLETFILCLFLTTIKKSTVKWWAWSAHSLPFPSLPGRPLKHGALLPCVADWPLLWCIGKLRAHRSASPWRYSPSPQPSPLMFIPTNPHQPSRQSLNTSSLPNLRVTLCLPLSNFLSDIDFLHKIHFSWFQYRLIILVSS